MSLYLQFITNYKTFKNLNLVISHLNQILYLLLFKNLLVLLEIVFLKIIKNFYKGYKIITFSHKLTCYNFNQCYMTTYDTEIPKLQ